MVMVSCPESSRLQGYKTLFMLNSAENEIFPAHKCKVQTVVGILTFMNRKSSIIGLSEPEKS